MLMRAAALPTAPTSGGTVIRLVAAVAVALVGSRIFVGGGATIGNAVALLLLPLWLPVWSRYRGGRVFAITGLVAAAAGLWLSDFSSADHSVSPAGALSDIVMLLGAIAAVGVLLWSRDLLPVWLIGTLYGGGMLTTSVLAGELTQANAWKFGLGFPLTVIVLSLLSRPGLRRFEAVALLAFAAAAVATDSRYRFATLMIAAVLIIWELVPSSRSRRVSTLTMLGAVSIIVVLTYNLATTLLIDGYLGEQAQTRTISQIELSGSLIAGGRPELAASVALFQDHPWGFGVGVSPNLHDVLVAKTGMAGIGYQPNNGYVENYLFGRGFELHSVAGDLWASFGLPGLAFVIVCVVLTLHSIGRQLGERAATGLVLVLGISTLWNALFSPIYGSLSTLVLTIGLGALAKDMGRHEDAWGGPTTVASLPRGSRSGSMSPFTKLQ
ncbi:O-antigen ligase family protein [Glaciibacter superstes]|uniref:O-antigen ligase family protein n=1 Tax=Glaciibacter superstes TaxID=501023 RepID=UPI0003B762D3|nr:O-antigen ligase family protein [Glaciibacter superstes]